MPQWADAAPVELSAPARMHEPTEPPAPATPALIAEPEELSAPARIDVPLRYKVQFTATEEYVELIERAQALLSHWHVHRHGHREHPATLDEIQLEALRAFVAQLEKKRAGARDAVNGAGDAPTCAPKLAAATRRSRHIPVASAAPSSSATRIAARMSTTHPGVAARKRTTSSSITWSRSQMAARTPKRT